MKTNRKAAVLALGLALLSPLAGAQQVVDSEWWKVDFSPNTPGGVTLEVGELGALTNQGNVVGEPAPYLSGKWYMIDGDESYVTNEYNPGPTGGTNHCIKLDTQGNDLTWVPTNVVNDVTNIYQKIALVDAELYLVGSDSAPDAADFDGSADVQSAVFLRNFIDEDSGDTTNSVLCVYAYDANKLANAWIELEGRAKTPTNDIPDTDWYHVTVLVDHETNPSEPMVEVYVDGIQLHARGGTAKRFLAANYDNAATAGRIQSVSFRGTGAIDNFVGRTREETYQQAYFKAISFFGTNEVNPDDEMPDGSTAEDAGLWQRSSKQLKIGKEAASFEGMTFRIWDDNIGDGGDWAYVLSRIEVDDFSTPTPTTRTYRYNYHPENANPLEELDPDPDHIAVLTEEWEGENFQSGYISVTNISTAGATPPANENDAIPIVRFYFEAPPQPGDFTLTASKNVGDDPPEQKFNANAANLPVSTTFTFPEMIVQGTTTNVLRRVAVTNAFDVAGSFADHTFTVTVPVEANKTAFSDKTIRVATATYAEGDYAGKQITAVATGNGVYEVGAWVAKIGETNLYESLRAAIEDAEAGATITMIADDHVSFSATATEIVIDKTLVIDGGSNTLYGVTDYAYDGVNDHDLFISPPAGDVTIKNLTFAEFSDTAPYVQGRTYPIWEGRYYTGTLTLDGVTVKDFARTAINLSGGSFVITNCVVSGYAGAAGAPAQYFQNAISVFNAKGTVADSTVSGIGSHEGSKWGAGLVTFNSDGNGEVTFKSGTYTADYLIEVASNATGKAFFEGGTFIATGTEESAFQLDEGEDATFYVNVTGGWYDRKPEAAVTVVRAPYTEVLDVDNAPDPAAEWTVVKPCTITFFEEDGTTEFFKAIVLSGTTGYGPANDPTKAETAQYAYVFTGWTNAVAGGETVSTANLPAATDDAAWTATFSAIPRTYDIVFLASDAIGAPVFFETNVFYGATDYGPTNDPTRESTVSTDFAFAGWTNADTGAFYAKDAALPEATTNATYTALYDETARKYAITWNMDDGTLIDTTEVEYGTVPTHAAPSKTDTEQFAYAFTGWDPEVVAVEGEATYAATFSVVVRSYDIRFFDGDELDGEEPYFTTNAPYGTPAALYAPADPTKDATSLTNFTFAGWTNEVYGGAALLAADLPTVSNETSWVAVWTETPIWTVDFYDGEDGGEVCYTTNVLDGTELDQPAAADLDPKPSKAATASHTFAFVGWTDEIGGEQVRWSQTITSDTAFYPVFESNLVAYAITFTTNGAVYATTNAPYGTTDYGPAADPAWDGHTFDGWTNAATGAFVAQGTTVFPAVGGTAEWTAVWTEDLSVEGVDPGNAMSAAEKAANPPVAVTSAGFTVHFKGVKGVTYELLAADSLSVTQAQWENPDGTNVEIVGSVSVTAANEAEVQTLVAPMTDNVKFFKIGARKTGN